ncbi:helix-turn-helix domain-containing protein [Neisseria gonorrhoeae]
MKYNADKLLKLHTEGHTRREIAALVGISVSTVANLLSACGADKTDGGVSVRTAKKKLAAFEKKIKERAEKQGTTPAYYLAAVLDENGVCLSAKDTLIFSYQKQRNNALAAIPPESGVDGWQFTFTTWYEKWAQSGKLSLRGRGMTAYGLIRKNMADGFSPENTVISKVRPQNYLEKD